MTGAPKEVLNHAVHADAGAALEKFQRESQELYKQYPPAKLYTQESLLEESKHLFKQGQLFPQRFVLKLQPHPSVILQIDAVVKTVRNEMEKAYPGSNPPPTNYYAINQSKGGSQYAYVGVLGGAAVEVPETTKEEAADSWLDGWERCLGLPKHSSLDDLNDATDAMYTRAKAVAFGLPDSTTPSEVETRIQDVLEKEQQLDSASLSTAKQLRESARKAYAEPYEKCISSSIASYWKSQ